MKQTLFMTMLAAAVLTVLSCSERKNALELYQHQAELHLDSLQHFVEGLLLPMAQQGAPAADLQKQFGKARLLYKQVEHVVEYYAPTTARFINGPPLPDLEVEEHRVFEPEGFQVVEELLADANPAEREELVRHLRLLLVNIRRVKAVWETTQATEAGLWDAVRLQMFRVMSLGLSGFDSPVFKTSMSEAAASLEALQETILFLHDARAQASFKELQQAISRATRYLRTHPDFDAFDRAYFIRHHANPICRLLAGIKAELGVPPVDEQRLLRGEAITLFDSLALRADFFSARPYHQSSAAVVKLGERLFYDRALSANGRHSCASCHQPMRAFTDGLARANSVTGKPLARNTPTLLNAALQNFQFYDMRSATLEDQARDVVENKDEMHGSFTAVVSRLKDIPAYREAFAQAFGADSLQAADVQFALAAYVRSLVSLNSPFDRYMRGDSAQLTAEQVAGFNLFMGKAQCGICHFMPLFSGTVPPSFVDTESEVLGVPAQLQWQNASIDPDLGRFAIFEMDPLRYAFKTPTVRNAALTSPYMHNGVYRTLEEVMKFYNVGGGAGIGIDLPNQTLAPDALNLTDEEQQKIIAFMQALTDTASYRQGHAPR